MKKNLRVLSALFVFWAASSAHAEIFICKDASGRTLTSDRPIPECGDRTTRVLGTNGTTKREIAPPMTAAQKKQKDEEDAKKKAEASAAEEQRRQDRALLARYKNEADIEKARKRDLELVQEQIKREELSIVSKEKNLKDTQKEAEFYKGKKMPNSLQRKIDDSEQAIKDSKKLITDKQGEIAQINAKFDQTIKRFRELNATASASVTAAAPVASK